MLAIGNLHKIKKRNTSYELSYTVAYRAVISSIFEFLCAG